VPGQRLPDSPESHAQESFCLDNSFLILRFYLEETMPLSLHLGSFGSPFFYDRHPEAGALCPTKDLGESRDASP
jgi:hypothetical protein